MEEEECLQGLALVTIELIGNKTEYVEINTSYTDLGVVAKSKDGEIIEEVETIITYNNETVETIDVTKLSTYEITYLVNQDDYTASMKRTVVVQDTMPPELTIPSNATIKIEDLIGFDYMEGVEVSDNSLEELEVIIISDIKAIPGEYAIVYSAKDTSGNETSKTRYITVIDAGYPEITILGSNPASVNIGESYIDSGATASDEVDGNITNKIVTTGTVNINVVGTYTIKYTVSDNAGNSTTVTRTVNVIDNVPPTIAFGTNGHSTYAKSRSTNVTITDAHSSVNASGLKYLWNTSTATPSEVSFTTNFTNGGTITSPVGVTGGYYLWILANDTAGNTIIGRSNIFNIDNTNPVISSVTSNATNISHNSFTINRSGNGSDAHSGLATNPYIYQTSTNGSTWTTKCTNNTTSCNVSGLNENTTYYYRICVNDVLGNQSCIASKTMKTAIGDYDIAKGVNKPQLVTGMTPIKWSGSTWINTTYDDPDWYDYANKQWANAKTSDGSFWVWIPRYAYQIASGYHTNTAGTINIRFLKAKTNTASNGTTVATTPTYSGSSQTNYVKHPAFNFGDEVLGFWVAKFEPSGTSNNINIVPNVASLRSMTIGDQFDAALSMKNNSKYGWNASSVDTHMMKNDEWGAVAYLSKSIYGANEEIWINNSSTYTTGCAGSSVSSSSYSGCQNQYHTPTGQKASTTHTIYGVYDMSGGAFEYTSAYVNNGHSNLTTYGQSILNANGKYKNVYSTGATDSGPNNYAANSNIFGDAVYETSSTEAGATSWYRDYSIMPYSTSPWFSRGGHASMMSGAGVFFFGSHSGNARNDNSFRPIVAVP